MSAEFGPTLPQATFTGQTINPEATRLQGDFAHMPPEAVVHVIDKTLRPHVITHYEDLNSQNGVRAAAEARRDVVAQEVQRLEDEVSKYRKQVKEEYPPEHAEKITGRYKAADETATGLSNTDRIKARLAQFEGASIISDVDKTITSTDNYLSKLPASILAEELLANDPRGRDAFGEIFVHTWQETLRVHPEGFREVGRNAPLREGVKDFVRRTKESGIDLTFLSANFEPFVEGVLDQIPDAEGTNYLAVTPDSIIATAKGAVVEHTALENPKKAVIFIGDGKSDFPAIQAASKVGLYCALAESPFAEELEKEGLPFITYRDFNDINVKLEELGVLKPQAENN